jgi:hypothetical protein
MHSGDRGALMSSDTEDGAPLEALLPRRKIVVVVGIDDYARLPKLRCAVSDAMGVQELFVKRLGFEAPIAPLINAAATKPAINALIEDELPKLLEKDDALIFFFAGHGTTRLAPLDRVVVETGYIAPVEARGPQQFSDHINMEELLRTSGRLPARHILVVLDACHSGIALGSTVSQYRSVGSYVNRLTRNFSRRVITSARRDEPALDGGPVPGHSLFTGTLIHALTSGEADTDGNGIITFSELALFLQQRVGQASESRQTPDYGAFHHDDRGEMVIAIQSQQKAAGGAPPEVVPETVIGDRYRIIHLSRQECVGNVFAAIDLRTGAQVAIKLLRTDDMKSLDDRRARLEREARAMSSIYSRHVPRVLEIAADKRQGLAIVAEPLEGELLIDRLKRLGPISFEELHPLIEQVWIGLTDIHKVGVIHRDLKPSNLFLEHGRDGVTRVKILDFGICKLWKADDSVTLTQMGQSLGTFSFMPPEQIGKSRLVDHRADIYACSTLIFQALSGQLPYNARNILVMVEMKVKTDARRLSEVMEGAVDPALEAFLARGLERDARNRFQSSEEALMAWRKLLPGGR